MKERPGNIFQNGFIYSFQYRLSLYPPSLSILMGFDAKHNLDENVNGPWLQHLVSIVSPRYPDETILITKLEQNKI